VKKFAQSDTDPLHLISLVCLRAIPQTMWGMVIRSAGLFYSHAMASRRFNRAARLGLLALAGLEAGGVRRTGAKECDKRETGLL
jgi:hypothetical protein